MRRLGGLIMSLLLSLASPAGAAAEDDGLPDGRAMTFTVAGGGTASPVVGRSATDVRLYPREAVYLPDGRIVIRDAEFSGPGKLVVVGADGRIGSLPPLPPIAPLKDISGDDRPVEVYDIDVERDGGLLVLVSGTPALLRLGPQGWMTMGVPGEASAVGAGFDGGLFVAVPGAVLSLSHDGAIIGRRALPP